MITTGIDRISFYTSPYYLDLTTLAKAQNLPAQELCESTGQYQMSVAPPDEDVVTLAANAAYSILDDINKDQIEILLFATESGIDQSKAAGIYVHQLLGLSKHCRVVELKQACYGATVALQMAKSLLQQHPTKKILLIASDIARYELNTTAEASQGCGAVAMLLTANPRILALEEEAGFYVEDAMDFWRPNYRREAFVNGRLSCDLYLKALKESWQHYQHQSNRVLQDHHYFCYHTPIPRLVENAHKRLARLASKQNLSGDELQKQIQSSLHYSRHIGNCYTASLYLNFISLLDNASENLSNKRIGFYSYGSGCTAEFFSGIVRPNYQSTLKTTERQHLFNSRQPLTYSDYLSFYQFAYPTDGRNHPIPTCSQGRFRLAAIKDHQRIYDTHIPPLSSTLFSASTSRANFVITSEKSF